jgi:hypothetical protein
MRGIGAVVELASVTPESALLRVQGRLGVEAREVHDPDLPDRVAMIQAASGTFGGEWTLSSTQPLGVARFSVGRKLKYRERAGADPFGPVQSFAYEWTVDRRPREQGLAG